MSQKFRNVLVLFGIIVLVLVLGSCFQQPLATSNIERSVAVGGEKPYPIPKDAVDVKVLVVDSVSGTEVTGTVLRVFDSTTKEQVTQSFFVKDGAVNVKVSPNKTYDFTLLGEKGVWASSTIQDYLVKGPGNLTMVQFKHGQKTRGVESPIITAVKKDSESGDDITRDMDIDDTINKIYVEFTSSVGAVEEVSWNGYGAKLSIGGMPGSLNGIDGEYTQPSSTDNIFKSKYKFDITKVKLPNEETELIIVGYDVANNRVEKRIPVKFKKTVETKTLDNAMFDPLIAIIERVPFSNSTFSKEPDIKPESLSLNGLAELEGGGGAVPLALKPRNGIPSSYKALIAFKVVDKNVTDPKDPKKKKPIPIIGFDIYRRDKGSDGEFKFVSRTHYDKPDFETSKGLGQHLGYDTTSELEENKEYEYKIKAFNENGILESGVLSGKVMESFTYSLQNPHNRKKVSLQEAENMSYSCKIDNTRLLRKEAADYCVFGLLIVDGQGAPVFSAKVVYIFEGVPYERDGKKLTGPDALITCVTKLGPRKLSYNEDLAGPLQKFGVKGLDDLVKFDVSTGLVTFTSKFVKVSDFNVGPNLLNPSGGAMKYEAGVNYQWDIQDWGTNAYSLNDDKALQIIKMYGDSEQSRSMGNNNPSGSNAVNGRFTFTVTE